MLIIEGKPKPGRFCMMMNCPLWMLWSMECNICGVRIKFDGPVDNVAGSGICRGVGGIIGI